MYISAFIEYIFGYTAPNTSPPNLRLLQIIILARITEYNVAAVLRMQSSHPKTLKSQMVYMNEKILYITDYSMLVAILPCYNRAWLFPSKHLGLCPRCFHCKS